MINTVFTRTWFCLGLIILGAILAYSNIFNTPFVFDDHLQIVENPRIKNLDYHLSLERLTSQRPLTNLTFALNHHFHGLDVFGYNVVNLMIHILAGITVFFLALNIFSLLLKNDSTPNGMRLISQVRLMALFTALIFVVHPLQTQAVTYIVQRYTSMAALFYLVSVLLYILARMKQSRGTSLICYFPLFFLALISGILAFLSKQSAASLPGAIALVEMMLFTRDTRSWRKIMTWIIPSFLIFLIFILYNAGFFQGQTNFGSLLEDVSSLMQETRDVTRLEYLYTQFTVIPDYLRLFIVPLGQNADPLYPFAKGFFDGFTPLGFLFLVFLVISSFLVRKRFPVITIGLFWFFITLSVESSIIPIRDAMFEHRMYLPMFGLALIVAWIIGKALTSRAQLPALVFVLVMIITLGVLTVDRNKVWKSGQSLWTDVLEKNPKSHRAHTNLGLNLDLAGEIQKAMYHYNRALNLSPDFPYAHLNMGAVLGELGRPREAEYHFRRALNEVPNNPRVLNNLGASIASQGKLDEALEIFRQAVRADGYFIEARFNLALTLAGLHKFDQARDELQKLLGFDPGNTQAENLLNRLEKMEN